MDENKREEQEQPPEENTGKKRGSKVMEIVTFVCLGVMVVCVIALLVLTYCFT